VAKQFAHLLTPFEVNLLVHDPYAAAEELVQFGARRVELETLMEESDVISLHAGWNAETEGMLNAELLDKIKPDALLVCTARLPIFDQQALARKIRDGLHFVSDLVPFDQEIWEDPELTKCENFIGVGSHTSITDISLTKMSRRIVDDLEAILSSQEPKNKITEEWILHTT
jgi:phosphoglycerate dehydrogenase-like enzyme